MQVTGANHPFVVWASYFLWLISVFSITWSLLLFLFVGDMLIITGTDLVNAFVLLSGIIMLPTNVHMLYSIANGKKIDHRAKVVCCPIWLCIAWIIIINLVGVVLCIHRKRLCHESVINNLTMGIRNYRNMPKYKHFIDNLQWALGCCGLNSYKDWFNHDWCDRLRDYEWDPSVKRDSQNKKQISATDSVPLSCCKSGSCISNYLLELGPYSINTDGCGALVYEIITVSMNLHLIMFLTIIVTELIILKLIATKNKQCNIKTRQNKFNIRHIMPAKDNFNASSDSCQFNPDESEDDASVVQVDSVKMDIYKGAGLDQYEECERTLEQH